MKACRFQFERYTPSSDKGDAVEALRRRLGKLEPGQIAAWWGMSPARRLELAFQAYQFALEAVRATERQPPSRPDARRIGLARDAPHAGEPTPGQVSAWNRSGITN